MLKQLAQDSMISNLTDKEAYELVEQIVNSRPSYKHTTLDTMDEDDIFEPIGMLNVFKLSMDLRDKLQEEYNETSTSQST